MWCNTEVFDGVYLTDLTTIERGCIVFICYLLEAVGDFGGDIVDQKSWIVAVRFLLNY